MANKTLCRLVPTLFLSASSILFSGCSVPKKVDFSDYKASIKNGQSGVDCAILVAEPTEWYEYFRLPFEPVYEGVVASALKERLEARKYTITFNATWDDLQDVLRDPSVRTIVIAGHGFWYSWRYSDRQRVTYDQVKEFMAKNSIPKKTGLFIKHTCGSQRYPNFSPVIDEKEVFLAKKYLEFYGARDVCIDTNWTEEDEMFGANRNRFLYRTKDNADMHNIEKQVEFWNALIAEKGRSRENDAFGRCIVDHPSKLKAFSGIVSPLEYLLNPIPGVDE